MDDKELKRFLAEEVPRIKEAYRKGTRVHDAAVIFDALTALVALLRCCDDKLSTMRPKFGVDIWYEALMARLRAVLPPEGR